MDYTENILTESVDTGLEIDPALSSQDGDNPNRRGIQEDEQVSTNGDSLKTLDKIEDPMAAPYDGLAVSLEAYWAEFYGQTEHTYEWNNGILEAKPMAKFIQVKSYLWFLGLLRDYLFGNAIAEMTLLETPFQFDIPDQTKVRIPDLAVVLNSNPVSLGLHDRTYKGIFDICIESVSDSDIHQVERDTVDKWDEYSQGGVTEYYILDERHPSQRLCETAFYQLDSSGVYQPIQPNDGIIRSTILPGFQFRIDDLYTCPTPLDMLEDPVYKGYTSPLVRAERERAERAEREVQVQRERVKQERTHVEQAQARADEEQARADEEQARADEEQARAEQEQARADEEQARAERAEQELQAMVEQMRIYLGDQGIPLPDDFIK